MRASRCSRPHDAARHKNCERLVRDFEDALTATGRSRAVGRPSRIPGARTIPGVPVAVGADGGSGDAGDRMGTDRLRPAAASRIHRLAAPRLAAAGLRGQALGDDRGWNALPPPGVRDHRIVALDRSDPGSLLSPRARRPHDDPLRDDRSLSSWCREPPKSRLLPRPLPAAGAHRACRGPARHTAFGPARSWCSYSASSTAGSASTCCSTGPRAFPRTSISRSSSRGLRRRTKTGPILQGPAASALRRAGRLVECDRFILSGEDIDPASAADAVWVYYEPDFVYSSSVLVRAALSGRPVIVRRRGVVGKQVEENGSGPRPGFGLARGDRRRPHAARARPGPPPSHGRSGNEDLRRPHPAGVCPTDHRRDTERSWLMSSIASQTMEIGRLIGSQIGL